MKETIPVQSSVSPSAGFEIWIVTPERGRFDLLAVALEEMEGKVEFLGNGQDAIGALQRARPLLVVLDLPLSDLEGEDFCSALGSHRARTGSYILALVGEQHVAKRFRLLAHGADEVVPKPFDGLELLLRLRCRARKIKDRTTFDREFLSVGNLVLDLKNHMALVDGQERRLTRSEFAVLRYLMENESRVVDAETLLVEALGYPQGLGNPDALRTHIRNLREKIEPVPSDPRRIINLPRLGYMVRGQSAGTERDFLPARPGSAEVLPAAFAARELAFRPSLPATTPGANHAGVYRGA